MEQQTVKADWSPPINVNSKDILILVVDDDHTSLAVIGGILRSWKCNVETVRNGGEALSILKTKTDKMFDLVVIDIRMPDMNGFELLRRISVVYQVPIVMMSSDDSEKTMTKGLECGAAYFMRKPVLPDDLQNLLLYAIPKKNQDSSSSQIVITDANNNLRTFGNSSIQQVSGSAHLAQIKNQQSSPITQYMHPTIPPVEKYYEEVTRRRKLSNWNQKPKVTTGIVPPNYPASFLFTNRKQKVAWSTGLHNKFLDALKIIGLDRAVPKKILEVMNVPGLTRENVASHLQKYRIFLKRAADIAERADGMSKTKRSKFASSYLPLHFGLSLEHLDTSDENLLRKKLKQELRAMRDPLYMDPSWRDFETLLPNNNVGTSTISFTSNYSSYQLEEPNKKMAVEGLVEFGGTSGNNNFMPGSSSIKEIMHQSHDATESNNYVATSDNNASGNNTNVNVQMITEQHSSAFVPYGMNMNSSEQLTGGLVNNIVTQGTNNFGQGYGMKIQNSGMLTSEPTFGTETTLNAPSQPLEIPNVLSGYMYDMSNNLDISGFQADFSEYLIQQLGGGSDQTINSLEQAGSNEGNHFLAFGNYSAQTQLQNKNQESEPISNQQFGEGSDRVRINSREGSYFGEDFNPWFDHEPTQTQAGNQNANMLVTDELYAIYQGFQGNAVDSSDSKKSSESKE